MLWRNKIVAAAISAAVGLTAATSVSAATPVQPASTAVTVNGNEFTIHTIAQGGFTLASVRELGDALGANMDFEGSTVLVAWHGHTLKLASGSDQITVDGETRKLPVPVTSVKQSNYIDLTTYVESFGGKVTAGDGSMEIDFIGDLLEDVSGVQWVNGSKLIASRDNGTGRIDYLVDVATGAYEQLFDGSNASELAVSPDGAKAAYTDPTGQVYLLDLATKASTAVGKDTSIKTELVWSSDGAALYFVQGEKFSVIAKLDLAAGTVSKVLEDKVDYKANLNVSADGKYFYYTVTKPGAVTADANKPVDADEVVIDTKGTEPQLYGFDSTVKDGKPVQLTATTDDKMMFLTAADGSDTTYVSVSDAADAKAALVSVSKDKSKKTVFDAQDVLQAVAAGGKIYVLAAGYPGTNLIYQIDRTAGTSSLIYIVPDSVTEITAGAAGGIAITQDGQTKAFANGYWKPVTR